LRDEERFRRKLDALAFDELRHHGGRMETGTSLSIRFAPHRGALRMEVSGPGTFANTLAYWAAITNAVQEHKPFGVLLIDTTTGELSATEWKTLVRAMVGKGLESTRIAHVKPRGLQRVEYCEFYAREAGFIARVFTNEVEADLWLRYGESAFDSGDDSSGKR
jgi:hypothetical protein